MNSFARGRTGASAIVAAWLLALPASLPAQERATNVVPTPVHPEQWPTVAWPIPSDPKAEARIAALIARMTIEEKVGQVIQADLGSVTPDDVRRYHLGSVLNGGSSGPYGDDLAPAAKWLQLADEFWAASTDTANGGVGIPVLWGTDAVHGHSNIVGATLFPHNIGLGAANDPELIEAIGAATAAEIRVTGQEWTFAPTITVPQDPRWGRTYEGYSSDPELVARYATRMILGLQGPPNAGPILAGPHVIASTKHFIADGGTFEGHDQGDARIDEATLRDVHGRPYVAAIEAGVGTVMTSFSSWNGTKIAGHKGLVTDVLKGRMNFGGFVVTDWNAHGQIAGCTNASCHQAINAGIDLYMAPDSWKPLYESLLAQARDGTVPMARLDDAVARVLRVKMRLGLFEAGKPSARLLAGKWELLGAPAHRALARRAVAESLVLLKNDGVLPLKPSANILVAGDAADDIARQSGGWTISWQGTGLTNADFPGATSIWTGIRDAVGAAGGHAELAPDGSFKTKPDAAIVVFGETPYAEFQGDLKTLQLRRDLAAGPLATMRKLKAQGIPVVAVMLTGRPLFVGPQLNAASAFVTAWLPGSEGAGVADQLFRRADGSAPHFAGRLPMAWPASARADGPVLFARGYGLSGSAPAPAWTPVSEDPGVEDGGAGGVFLGGGAFAPGWGLEVSDGGAAGPVTALPYRSAHGRVAVSAANTEVQEGARAFVLRGGAPQRVAVRGAAPIDLTREANGDVLVVATIRFDGAVPKDARLAASCVDDGCATRVAIPAVPTGSWTTLGVPLKCFGPNPAMAGVSVPFAFETRSAARFAIARVALATSAEHVATCK